MCECEDLLYLVGLMEETGKTSHACIFSVESDVKCHLLHFNDHNRLCRNCNDVPILKPYIQDVLLFFISLTSVAVQFHLSLRVVP